MHAYIVHRNNNYILCFFLPPLPDLSSRHLMAINCVRFLTRKNHVCDSACARVISDNMQTYGNRGFGDEITILYSHRLARIRYYYIYLAAHSVGYHDYHMNILLLYLKNALNGITCTVYTVRCIYNNNVNL